MNIKIRITIACFMGATLGGLLALQFATYYWWVGVLIGGGIAYLAYDFKEIGNTAKTVWQKMPERKELFESFSEYAKDSFAMVFVIIIALTIIVCLFGSMLFSVIGAVNVFYIYADSEGGPPITLPLYMAGTFCTVYGLGFLAFLADNWRKSIRVFVGVAGFAISPIGMFVTLPLIALAICCGVIYFGYRFVVVVCKCSVKTLYLVHSDIRLLCMTDATIGAVAGYLTGNALLGGLIGVVLGLLNYELVSVRWLKLVVRRK